MMLPIREGFKSPHVKSILPLKVNWSNSLTRGLTRVYLLNGPVVHELISGRVSVDSKNITTSFDTRGQLSEHASNGAMLLGRQVPHTGRLSIVAGITPASVTGTQSIFTADSSDIGVRSWQFRLSGDKVNFIPFVSNSNGTVTGATALTIGQFHIVGCTHDDIAGANNIRVYVDGVQDGQASKAGSLDPDNAALGIGCRFSNVTIGSDLENFDGNINFIFCWGDRFLSASEHLLVSRDINQLLIPSVPRFYFIPEAAPGGLSIPVAMYNYRRRRA